MLMNVMSGSRTTAALGALVVAVVNLSGGDAANTPAASISRTQSTWRTGN